MNRKTLAGDRRRRKLITFGWSLALGIGTILLIYWEKTALLYILATLGVTALLVAVAMSDLAHHDGTTDQAGARSRDPEPIKSRAS